MNIGSRRLEQLVAADTLEHKRGVEALVESGLPSERVKGAYWLLGNAAYVLLAEQRARTYREAADHQAAEAVDFRERLVDLASTVDPAAIAVLPEPIRRVINESMAAPVE